MPSQKRKSKRYKAVLVATAIIGTPVGIIYAWNAASHYIENHHAPMGEKEALAKLGDVRAVFAPQRYKGVKLSTGAPHDNCVNVNFTDGTRAVVYRDDKAVAVAPVTRRFDSCRDYMQKDGEAFRNNPGDPRILSASAVQYRTEAEAEKATDIFQRYAEDVVRQAFRENPKARVSVSVDNGQSPSAFAFSETQPVPKARLPDVRQAQTQSDGTEEKPVLLSDLIRPYTPYILLGLGILAGLESVFAKRPSRKPPGASAPTDNTLN